MTDAPPIAGAQQQQQQQPPQQTVEQEQNGAAGDEEEEEEEENVPASRSLFYTPALSTPEVEDKSDPYGSSTRRADAVLRSLSAAHIPPRLHGLESQESELFDLLSRTMSQAHNNAALLLGPRGGGKTVLLEHCLARLRREWKPKGKSFTVVRLNGNIQTDDTLAMRSERLALPAALCPLALRCL